MSTTLEVIGRQTLELGSLTSQADDILAKLKAYPFKRSLKHDHKTEEEGDWHYQINYCEKEERNPWSPWVEIHFCGPFSHFPVLRPNNVAIGSFYNYSYLMLNKSLQWFNNYRKELWVICQILDIDEVLYMADQSNFLGLVYQEWVTENWPYDEIKKRIVDTLGPPRRLEDAVDFDSYEAEEAAGQWFLDDFRVFRIPNSAGFKSGSKL